MRILLIHQYFLMDGEGGGGRWNEITQRWTKQGDELIVFAGNRHYLNPVGKPATRAWYTRFINKDGVEVIQCRSITATEKSFFLVRVLEYVSFAFLVWIYVLVNERRKIDYLIATSPPLTVALAAIGISWWKKCPYCAEVRDLWPESAIEMGILNNSLLIRLSYLIEKWYYHYAKVIVVLTPAFQTYLHQRKGIALGKLYYIPNAVDFQLADRVGASVDTQRIREELQLENKFVIVYVGAHSKANGLLQLVHVAQRYEGTEVYFLCIGNGNQKALLQEQVQVRNLQNIRFLDVMEKQQVLSYIYMADVGVTVLEKKDIFQTIYSNKTFDYFSCRKPVVMAVNGASRELVEAAQAGTYVDYEDIDSWKSAIDMYRCNPALTNMHGENGYRYALQHFDRDRWAQIYRQIINRE